MKKLISNAGRIITVPTSTEGYYKTLGWKEYKESKPAKQKAVKEEAKPEYIDKPISGWTKEQLKDYADKNGVDLSEVSKVEDVRKLVKEHLEGK